MKFKLNISTLLKRCYLYLLIQSKEKIGMLLQNSLILIKLLFQKLKSSFKTWNSSDLPNT